MKPKGSLLPLLCLAIASLTLPAGATAKPDKLVIPPGFSIEATLPKSDGFAFTVSSFGHRQISVVAERKSQVAIYTASGRASRHGFSVDFGRFGRMQMRFDGATGQVANSKGCKGQPSEQGIGGFVGHLSFRGRDDFAAVAATRVRGRYVRSFRQVCNQSGFEVTGVKSGVGRRRAFRRAKISGDVLEAESHADHRTTSFAAIAVDGFDTHPFITASVVERVDGIRLFAFTHPQRDPGSLTFAGSGADPENASVSPGAPFSGEAFYAKPGDGPAQWSGDLRVPIAGYGNLSLTGPAFQASACHANLESFSSCAKAQGSGSHSQPLALARLSSLR
jgi:hypothetical protein